MQPIIDMCADKLVQADPAEARRLFHGRGHTFPGLEHIVVTWYPPYLHVAFYRETPREEIDTLVNQLVEIAPSCEGVVVQFRSGRHTHTETWHGEVPDEILVQELGLSFWVFPKRNQNTGLFLDMGHVRQALSGSMAGAKVLNLFAYTCAFSVSAIEHGAQIVVNNDMNANVLEVGKRNHMANGHDLRKVRFLAHNVFKSWKKIRSLGPYDVIIIDPPTNQRGSFNAEKHYPQVIKRISELAVRNARIIACLNSPFLGLDFLQNNMSRWCPNARLELTYDAHPDFPEASPDRGLKIQGYSYKG